jgi:HAD superfamily hydrolase (TIGR01509 family)
MIQAFIFDLDGTLMDSEVLWVEAVGQLLSAAGHAVPDAEVVEIVYGKSWHDVYRAIGERFPSMRIPRSEMEADISRRMRQLRPSANLRIEGSVALLKRLAATQPVCIVSGSPRADLAYAVAHLNIGAEVSFYLGAEDYAPGKPSPAGFLLAAERLGVPPASCLVFEDSSAGVRAAKAAGMRCVALVRNGAPSQDVSAADLQVADLGAFSPRTIDAEWLAEGGAESGNAAAKE